MIKLRSGNIIIITLLECMNAEDTLLDCNLLEHTKGEKFMGEEREREQTLEALKDKIRLPRK